jgi:hypothetical protein
VIVACNKVLAVGLQPVAGDFCFSAFGGYNAADTLSPHDRRIRMKEDWGGRGGEDFAFSVDGVGSCRRCRLKSRLRWGLAMPRTRMPRPYPYTCALLCASARISPALRERERERERGEHCRKLHQSSKERDEMLPRPED